MYFSQFGCIKKPKIPKFENYSISEHHGGSSLCSCKPKLKIDSKFRFFEGNNASTSIPDLPCEVRQCACDILCQEPARKISVKTILKQAEARSDGVSVMTVASSQSKTNCKKLTFAGDCASAPGCQLTNPKDKNISVNVQVNLKKKRKKKCDCNKFSNESGTCTKQPRKCVCKKAKVIKRKKSCECHISRAIVICDKRPEKRENFIMDAIKKLVHNNGEVNFFPYFNQNNRNKSQEQNDDELVTGQKLLYCYPQKEDIKKRCKCKKTKSSVVSKSPKLEDILEQSNDSQKTKTPLQVNGGSLEGTKSTLNKRSAMISDSRNEESSRADGKTKDSKEIASLKEIYKGDKLSFDSQAFMAKKV